MSAGVHPSQPDPLQSAVRESALDRERVAAVWSARIAGVFVLVLAVVMAVNHWRIDAPQLLNPPSILEAREELIARPNDEPLKEKIRTLDESLRHSYFAHLRMNAAGAWLLLAGSVVFVLSAGRAMRMKPAVVRVPGRDHRLAGDTPSRSRNAVVITGCLVLACAVIVAITTPPRLSLPPGTDDAAQSMPAFTGPTDGEWESEWPRFLGPHASGRTAADVPLRWDVESGEGVAWKAEVPLPGFSSPIIWKGNVFLTGGTKAAREVFCYDAVTGTMKWRCAVAAAPAAALKELDIPDHTGYAASTPATDGRNVYAIFATGEMAAVDFEGKVRWTRFFGVPENAFGHASSLTTWRDMVLVQLDQGDADSGKSRLYALDGANGRVRWEQSRSVPSSWTSPAVLSVAGRRELVTLADPWVISYDPDTGAELWRAECLEADLAPSPVAVDDLVVVCSPGKHVLALRAGGQGDVSASHVVWKYEALVPDITSPTAHRDLLFLLGSEGRLACLEAATGKVVWEKFLDAIYNASPMVVGERLLVIDTQGAALWLDPGREYRELARANAAEPVYASPAAVDGRLFIRGEKHLFGIGSAPPADHALPGKAGDGQ
jgi:outer membrane protein assembly factor BamB